MKCSRSNAPRNFLSKTNSGLKIGGASTEKSARNDLIFRSASWFSKSDTVFTPGEKQYSIPPRSSGIK